MSTEATDGGAPAGEDALSEVDANRLHEARQKIIDELGKIIVGQEQVIDEISANEEEDFEGQVADKFDDLMASNQEQYESMVAHSPQHTTP